jgi:hypothetical protein
MISHRDYSGFFCLFPAVKAGESHVLAGPLFLSVHWFWPGTELVLNPADQQGSEMAHAPYPRLQTFAGKILRGPSQQVCYRRWRPAWVPQCHSKELWSVNASVWYAVKSKLAR